MMCLFSFGRMEGRRFVNYQFHFRFRILSFLSLTPKLGLLCVRSLVSVDIKYTENHQMAVIDCLDSSDETIQVRAWRTGRKRELDRLKEFS